MAAPVTEVWYILVDHNLKPTFGGALRVKVPLSGLILDLMDNIKEQRQNVLAWVDADRLEVWRLRNPRGSTEIKRSLPNLIHLDEVLVEGEDEEVAWLVSAEEKILSHFSELPENKISVLVRVSVPPPQIVGLKRPQEEEADQVPPFKKYLQDTLYARLAPSDVAKPGEFRSLQDNEEQRILNDRPHKDVQITPIALLYPPFGEFLDHIRNPPMNSDDVDLAKLEAAVNEFSSLMCRHYADEDGRRKTVLEALNAIFECHLPSHLTRMIPSPISGNRASDGHADGPAGVLEAIVEFENELGSGYTDPEVQITAYYLQSLREESSGRHEALFERFLFPALGISVMGSYIGFSALVILDQCRFVGLTPLLSARSPSGDDSAAPMLFHAFWAACMLRARICRDTRQAMDHPPVLLEPERRNLPYVREIPAWSSNADVKEQHLKFTIDSVIVQGKPWNEKRFLYLAKMQNDYVIVKIARRYCTDLHQFCAKRGHAPKLLGYGTVPGGWHVVVMELVTPDINKTLAHYAPTHLERWEKDLTHLMEEFHDEGLVHGDLRDANFIFRVGEPERIILVDYDWGGKLGDVSFPTRLLHEDLTGGELKSPEITKEHDRRVLRATFEKLKLSVLLGGEADEMDVS